jgi:hypothetical protein
MSSCRTWSMVNLGNLENSLPVHDNAESGALSRSNCTLLWTGFTVYSYSTVCHLSSTYILVSQSGSIYESFRQKVFLMFFSFCVSKSSSYREISTARLDVRHIDTCSHSIHCIINALWYFAAAIFCSLFSRHSA